MQQSGEGVASVPDRAAVTQTVSALTGRNGPHQLSIELNDFARQRD